jgi:hypothetical protein
MQVPMRRALARAMGFAAEPKRFDRTPTLGAATTEGALNCSIAD